MKKLSLIFLLLAAQLSVSSLQAGDAQKTLNRALKSMDNVTAKFKQTLFDEDKKVISQSEGTLAIQRPGKFVWAYNKPFDQRIIADGKELWIYDVELSQVTVKPMDDGLATAPIMILMKKNGIGDEFTVTEVGQREILYWVSLEPRTKDLEFSQIFIGMKGDKVHAMELRDNFGQSTQIEFNDLRTGVVHDPKTFKFKPPKGVDVYGVGG